MNTVKYCILLCFIGIIVFSPQIAFCQERTANVFRGSIPGELLRPRKTEALRYPVDMVIGKLGRDKAPAEAYSFARKIAEDLIAGNSDAASLKTISADIRENYLKVLGEIGPKNFRIGGGKEGNDGAISFLIRFIGRELAITGELYVRKENVLDENRNVTRSFWVFEDLLLEEAQNRKEENDKSEQRFDFTPYHRFF